MAENEGNEEAGATGRTLATTAASLQLLETLVQNDGATAADLTADLDLAHSTVHTHLNTLSEYGYVVREGNTYHAGGKFCHIGDYVRRRKPEYRIAGEIVADLAQQTKLEADFAVEENGRVISLHNELNFAESSHFLTDGRFFHVHSTASGKAMLAAYSEDKVRRIIERVGLPAETDRTTTDPEELLSELEEIRERGYATNNEEAIDGLWAVAKAVNTPLGGVCGSLNLSGPTYLSTEDMRQSAVETLEEQVERFETRIEEAVHEKYGQIDSTQ
ncbi:ArcR family transcription regulator [Natronococcus amylolyticus DSM 10524]|uniref:ArcR family transcription regulator n=1 Tax=Natronococcus amylolyticus DSM 10524 TaxID=1227497 RepID=L9WZU8_9EURY|nr:IclR family transcriptional regulator C-terminal domain-containing protein [Natronococcus amylolyticus]ELY54917.1 ArcR family transcription regulator [Natronococcus amylolyticus DSM 10524]